MGRAPEQPLHPLSPGTRVGAWRVVSPQGQGGHGAVYRAVRVGKEHSGPVALKLSLFPWGFRFAREAELLSRLSHPGIPRLLDRGVVLHPPGLQYPFFVMEWVEGMPLYAWAEQHAPSCREVCEVLAQLARALEALHVSGGVHRDLKGDNVLIRLLDRRPVLIDFGSGHYPGAERITWQSRAPFTPGYVSPQAYLFDIGLERNRDGYYPPSPADDLFALGVTAYRLVMGDYPPPMRARQDEAGTWHVTSPDPRPLLESNPRVEPLLREWILRLLSQTPEARGTATQAAEALEAEVAERVPELLAESQPAAEALPPNSPTPVDAGTRPERATPLKPAQVWKPWLATAAAGACAVLLWSVWPALGPVSTNALEASDARAPDAGTAAVGDNSSAKPQASKQPPTEKKPIAQEALPEPRPGQARPDKKGQCPGRKQVPINGGCWVEQLQMTAEECAENYFVFFKGKCFAHANAPPRKPQPTSSPAKEP
jgi:serine/threonine protein kinase